MTFYIPAIMIVAEHLSMYSNERYLQSYRLFTLLIRRVNIIMKEENKQIGEQEVMNYLTIAVNYRKNVKAIQDALKTFLVKYELRTRGFMPVYYLYFTMIAEKESKLAQDATIDDAMLIIKEV